MKTLTVKVPDDVFAEIATVECIRNVPNSEIIRERRLRAAELTPAGRPSLWSRTEDLVSATDLLPTDLSSNKVHLEGYGENSFRGGLIFTAIYEPGETPTGVPRAGNGSKAIP